MTPQRRVYEMRLLTGLFLAAPLALLVIWYAWSAFASFDRYRRAADRKLKLTPEMFQLVLHDELERDLRRFRLPDRPEPSALPTYELSFSRDNLDKLNSGQGPAQEGEASYVEALVKKNGEVHEARVRYRGGQPWHYLGAQKSMKVRVERGELLDGARSFNLINDPTPFGLEDQLILDLARESGLLTPEYRPVWVRINNSDAGVYRYEAQPDEGLLRRNRRMPGSIYSGDAEDGTVFADNKGWRKVSSRSAETKTDLRELDRLLAAIHGTHEEFAEFTETQFDLEKYAKLDALDVVFGGAEHDWSSNHKLYVDPYTGRFEPIAFSFRGFQHEPVMNFVDHPLLIRLKMTPGFLAMRDREVYALLTERASVPAIRARAESAMAALAPELAADPWWDAYKLLPRVSRAVRFLPRPMSFERWVLAGEAEISGFAERSRYLLNVLEEPGVAVSVARASADVARVDLVLSGEAAYAFKSASFRSSACASASASSSASARVEVFADVDLDGAFDVHRDLPVAGGELDAPAPIGHRAELYAGVRLIAHEDPRPKSGPVRTASEPRTYTYFARAPGCPLDGGTLELDNLVTGGTTRLALDFKSAPPIAPRETLPDISARVAFIPGERSPHAWRYAEKAAPELVVLGPGIVRFPETMRFGANQTVRIAPKTVFAMGPLASIIFRGPVQADGPLTILRADPASPWGGIALQGPGTAGSRLRGWVLRGGTRVREEVIEYSALLNIHDTRDIEVDRLIVEGASDSEDLVHANTVTQLVLHELSLDHAPIDAIDLELTTADLSGIRVNGAGDDCLDLGGADLRIRDSVLLGCTNNAVSAGEESEVSMHGMLIGGAKIGVLAKNGGDVRATRSVIWDTEIALKTNFKEVYYTKKSAIGASELYAPRAGAVRDAANGTTIEAGSVQASLPDENALPHLREHVLRLDRWSELETSVAAMREGHF